MGYVLEKGIKKEKSLNTFAIDSSQINMGNNKYQTLPESSTLFSIS